MAETPDDAKKPEQPQMSRVGKFIQSYHTFLSTFVIGAAGLIATSIWQYRQAEMSRHQAESQLQIAKTQAENQWRIERAEILSKNLQVLATRGEASVDQRYGVLLSLTRGDLLDPELGVSYALELGRDNPEYMKSVLSSTPNKDYIQLAHAFTPTCEQRYGVARQVDLCKTDAMAARSDAIARLVSEEAEAWVLAPPAGPDAGPAANIANPLEVLRDDRQVQKEPTRMIWLFAPCITALAQRKQWPEVRRFEAFSDGARLVVALVLATVHSAGTQTTTSGTSGKGKRRAERREWLAQYLLGRQCDDDCRARFAELMLTGFNEAQGEYDDVLKRMLMRPATESDAAVERIHTRLVRCQVDPSDAVALRDRVVVPLLTQVLTTPKPDPNIIDNLIDLMSPMPEPTEPPQLALWTLIIARLQKGFPEKYRKGYLAGRRTAEEERNSPPPSLRKVSFCKAPEVPVDVSRTSSE